MTTTQVSRDDVVAEHHEPWCASKSWFGEKARACDCSPSATETSLRMTLRLAALRQDESGWLATFFGKPDIHGNSFTVPVSEDVARLLVVGGEYVVGCPLDTSA